MNEKAYKNMGFSGIASLVLGIVTLIGGLSVGILMILSGVGLMKARKDVII